MREDTFKAWLVKQGSLGQRPIGDVISRCKRICRDLNIDLDNEYTKDGGRSLIGLLDYTAEDAQRNIPVPKGLKFKPGSNIKNGMASLKAAVSKYFEFCAESE